MKSGFFGTDGVRGVANKDLTPHLAFKLGQAGAHVLSKFHKKPSIVVGKDTRISGDMLEAALTAGVCSAGADVIKVGVVPTPAVAYLTRNFKADAGVVISASHNPMEYNGVKFFNNIGHKLSDVLEDEIEALINDPEDIIKRPIGSNIGKIRTKNGIRPYVDFVKTAVDVNISGLVVAVDCANGASFKVAPMIFKELGAKVHTINDSPTGININVNCGSTYPDVLSDFVKKVGADVGLAFDGDADRLIAVDEKGGIVDGDHIMAICGIYKKKQGFLKTTL